MKIIGLPGVNPATEPWLRDLIAALGDSGRDSIIVEYRHWSDDGDADLVHEAGRLENVSADLVIGKSFGTAVATLALDACGFRPKQAVFIGTPLKRHGLDGYNLLRRFVDTVPTLFIQQSEDFAGSFRALNDVVGHLANATTREVSGDDHVYGDIEALGSLIRPAL